MIRPFDLPPAYVCRVERHAWGGRGGSWLEEGGTFVALARVCYAWLMVERTSYPERAKRTFVVCWPLAEGATNLLGVIAVSGTTAINPWDGAQFCAGGSLYRRGSHGDLSATPSVAACYNTEVHSNQYTIVIGSKFLPSSILKSSSIFYSIGPNNLEGHSVSFLFDSSGRKMDRRCVQVLASRPDYSIY